jgi:predicted phage-related endonuclease
MADQTIDLAGHPVARAWLAHCTTLRREITKLQAEYDHGVQAIKDVMGDAAEATLNGTPVITWKASAPSEYIDSKALRADLPDIAAKYTKTKAVSRPFRILEPGA